MNNFVAKHSRTFNKSKVYRDKTKFHRASTRQLTLEWYDEVEEFEQPGIARPKEFETPSVRVIFTEEVFNCV